jgi:AcrR family transcriptional regulator
MVRTVDIEAHAIRREAFADAAQRLIQKKGYDQMSVQDVIDELGTSRGAFYHYFGSKTALLEAVVARIADAALASVAPLVDDPNLAALPKFEGFFGGIAQWKLERTELMLALTRVWMSDENTLMRDKTWQGLTTRLAPPLGRIIRQGKEEGVFTVSSPDATAQVIVALTHGLNDVAVRSFLDLQAGGVTPAAVETLLKAYLEAMERVLGVPGGSLVLVDREVLHRWFA